MYLLFSSGNDLMQGYDNLNPYILSARYTSMSASKEAVKYAASKTAKVKSETTASSAEYLIKVNTAEKILL